MSEDEKMPLGDMNWLELRRINDKLVKIMSMLPVDKKVIDFDIFDFANTKEMRIEIVHLMGTGWSPYGQQFFHNNWLYIPMVKYDN